MNDRGTQVVAWLAGLNHYLEGWPNEALTIALVIVGLVYIGIGLFCRSGVAKAAALAYGIFP